MSLRVLDSGLQTLVVDGGRPSTRSLGVSLGGAADRTALALGNALLGNPPDAAALEFCLAGPTLQATAGVECAISGAPFDVPQGVGRTFYLHPDEVLRIGGTTRGARGYLCVRGGLLTQVVLGSRSSLEPVARGTELPCEPSPERPSRRIVLPTSQSSPIRAIPGPQADWFDARQFFGPTFEVTPASNRLGWRLRGEPLNRAPREMVSEPVATGAVQVVNDGQCIVLGVDGQTIGGYPKVAQVIVADLDRLGQLRPGERVTYAAVGLDEAAAAYAEYRRFLHEWTTRLAVTRAIRPGSSSTS